jgi:hypothetical protein
MNDPSIDQLAAAWRSFVGPEAGPGARLSFRRHLQAADSALLARLAELETTFAALEPGHWLKTTLKRREPSSIAWAESRRCLVEVLSPEIPGPGAETSLAPRAKPRAAPHGGLRATSLSHTRDASIAVSAPGSLQIGVDLEAASRPVSVAAQERILGRTERRLGLSALQAWTIKEACYKADGGRSGAQVPRYEIVGADTARLNAADSPTGAPVRFRFKLLRHESWIIAFAAREES